MKPFVDCSVLYTMTLVLSVVAGCGDPDATKPNPEAPPTPLPPLADVKLTTDRTLVLSHEVLAKPSLDPRIPEERKQLVDEGYGAYTEGAGMALQPRTLDAAPAPLPGANPKLLSRFIHLADTQLADDESPSRTCSFDAPGPYSGPFRAHEAWGCRLVEASVRTINAVHKKFPLDLVVLGGDNIDNAQSNELDWFHRILNGDGIVSCDSGADDDLVPGPGNDPKDPFAPVGLDVPWYWVTGNHDALVQGTFVVSDFQRQVTIGTDSPSGTRDYQQPGGPIGKAELVADPKRALMNHAELAKALSAANVRGIDADVVTRERVHYTFDSPDGSIRFVVIDSTSNVGSAEGLIRQSELDDWILPTITKAEMDGKWVILLSHHASFRLTDGGNAGGMAQADAVTMDAFRAAIAAHPKVIAHLAGHMHEHHVEIVTAAGRSYWELETSALADFPYQMRLLEVWDLDNGFLSIRTQAVDLATDEDSIAEEGRVMAYADYTSGWGYVPPNEPPHINVELFLPKTP